MSAVYLDIKSDHNPKRFSNVFTSRIILSCVTMFFLSIIFYNWIWIRSSSWRIWIPWIDSIMPIEWQRWSIMARIWEWPLRIRDRWLWRYMLSIIERTLQAYDSHLEDLEMCLYHTIQWSRDGFLRISRCMSTITKIWIREWSFWSEPIHRNSTHMLHTINTTIPIRTQSSSMSGCIT